LNKSLIRAIIILPVNVLIVIPCLLLWLTKNYNFACGIEYPWSLVIYFIGLMLAIPSLFVMFLTVRLFATKGEGTPAPWDPPKKFVVLGPYRYVRNPMLIGVLVFLLSEVLVFGSFSLFMLFVCFLAANMVYFPFVEEKGLEKRFGDPYLEYKRNVPRWIPRLKPWEKTTR
jgi:protein-S-isoprenylcysteine O-methyltransferase Ste14